MSIVYRIMLNDVEHPKSLSKTGRSPTGTDCFFQVKCYHTFRTQYIWIVPLLCALVFPFFCISMYLIALSYGHIEAIFPYISDTGALPPEAGFFDQLMDIAAILVLITGYIRYKQVKYYIASLDSTHSVHLRQLSKLYTVNLYSMLSLYPCSIGLMMIGNFRTSELPALHLTGNALILGIVLSVLFQIYLCRQLWSAFGIESPPTTMSIMLSIGLLFTVLTFIFTYTSFFTAGLNNAFNFNFGLHWTRDKPGFTWHILATITEWLAVAVAIPFYFVCLCRRMKAFQHWDVVWK